MKLKTVGVILVAVFCGLGIYEIVGRTGAEDVNPLINISELPEEFMETYMADYAELAASDNKENILIVTSATELANDFGARRVVKAANNQYFLEFETAEEKDFAYRQMSEAAGLTVSENHLHELFDDNTGDGKYNSWGIEKMGLDHASELVENASDKNDVVVAITDTGLDIELFLENYPAEKLAGEHSMVEPDGKIAVDDVGHGTHIAGTIAEGTPSNVKILPIQMTKVRSIYATDVIAAIDYVVYYTDADVINMSFGSPDYVEAEYLSIEAAKEKGIIPVAAAGNETISAPRYPSAFDDTISVSALDSELNFANDFSNYGSMIDFGAPGAEIKSINATWSGTSMAAPHVVAAASIAKSLRKDFNLESTKAFLATRAIDLGPKGRDNKYGYGFIDFNGARLCTAQSEGCDEFGIFETEVEEGIEIGEAVLTPYNYGSLTNILATPVKIKNKGGSYTERLLGDFGTDIEITGYDPYAAGEQEVSVKYGDFETVFTVENPDGWESGWIYTEELGAAKLAKYKDHGLNIKTLYFPSEIDGKTVSGSLTCPFNNSLDDGSSSCDGADSVDSGRYEVAVLPASYVYVNGFNAEWDNKVRFQNLYKVVSLADEITVEAQAFSGLHNLQIVDAKVKFAEGAESVFARDELLESVTISENNTIIPKNTFKSCGSLETVELPDSITEIGESAFINSGIRKIDLKNVQKLNKEAFAESNLEELEIPATLTEIDFSASLPPSMKRIFSGTNSLRKLTVAQDNPVFDSRDDSNAIIETAEDKLVIGTRATVIPASAKTIGEGAFDSVNIDEITVPEGVKAIETEAFANSAALQKVVMPRSLEMIDDEAFADAGTNAMFGTVFWVWNDSAAFEWATERDLPYVLMDEIEERKEPALVESMAFEAIPEDRDFYALETLSPENYVIKVFYRDKETKKPVEEPEIITNYTVVYNDGESERLKGGSNQVTLTFGTATGYKNIKVSDTINAKYLTPEYGVPTGISAYSGQALAEIELPEGFSWMDEEEFVEEGKTEYLARFTPEDTTNYKVVENIAVPVEVKVGVTFAEIFPDEKLRACIVESLGYTEETVDLDEVFGMTELVCGEGVADARGIERMTKLESLDLANDSLRHINLSRNSELKSLNLRANKIERLDLRNNPKLAELLVDESEIEADELMIRTTAYMKKVYDGEAEKLVMDISELEFLKNVDFTLEDASLVYDTETGVIEWPESGAKSVRINVGATMSYTIYGFPRDVYATIILDEKVYEENYKLDYTYTGTKLNLDNIAKELTTIHNLSKYKLADAVVMSAEPREYVVGMDDVKISFYFQTKGESEPDDSEAEEDDGEAEDDESTGTAETDGDTAGVPGTGFMTKMGETGDGAEESLAAVYFAAAMVVVIASVVISRK